MSAQCLQGQADLFEDSLDGMVHRAPLVTEVKAAAALRPRLKALQTAVLDALRRDGPLTDEQLEERAEFRGFGPSTIRKRRSELYQLGLVIADGERINTRGRKMLAWRTV